MREAVAEFNPEALFCDGFDEALIGTAERYGLPPVAAYDYDLMIKKLMTDDMTEADAVDYFEFNIIGAWVGDTTPIFVRKLSTEKNHSATTVKFSS